MAAGSVSRPRSRTQAPRRRACVPYERGWGLPRLVAPEVASALASEPTSTHAAPVISRGLLAHRRDEDARRTAVGDEDVTDGVERVDASAPRDLGEGAAG